jgi:hypothetical protein
VQFLAMTSPELSLANISPGLLPIGRPDNRFGFDQVYNTPAPGTQTVNGAPREYALPYNSQTNTFTSTTPVFFGRYTDEETSNTNFQFPGALPVIGGTPTSPMGSGSILGLDSTSYTMWLLNATPPTAPTAELSFAGGARRGEDILLTNVISFDVKLWDAHYSEAPPGGITPPVDLNRNGVIDTTGGFVDVGFPNVIPGTPPQVLATGDFQQSNNAFPVYGPNLPGTYVVPPAGTYSWAPAYTYASASNGATYNYNNVFDTWYRYFNFDNLQRDYDSIAVDGGPGPVATTGILLAPAPYRPRLGNPWTANTPYALGAQVDPANTANGYVYVCTQAGTSGAAPAGQPDPFCLSDQVGQLTQLETIGVMDGTVAWQAQPPVNVQAIQITVKYLDPSQNLLRQVTIVQSLTK